MTTPILLPRTHTNGSANSAPMEPPAVQSLAIALVMQSPDTLLCVLTTVARLGCRLTSVELQGNRAALALVAPFRVAHRVAPLLGELVEVHAVSETLA